MNNQKDWVQETFDKTALAYGGRGCSFYEHFGSQLVAFSGVQKGASALDVATGRGAALFPLAKKVGPTGVVCGIDISKKMLLATQKDAHERNLDWIHFQYMDAENLQFPNDTFDAVFCGFALFFFPQLQQALSEFKRILLPKGRLFTSTWGKKPELITWVSNEAIKMGANDNLSVTPLSTKSELKKIFSKARLPLLKIKEEKKVFWYESPEAWWNSLWTHGIRARLEQLNQKNLLTLRDAALEKAATRATAKGVPETFQVYYCIAQKESK